MKKGVAHAWDPDEPPSLEQRPPTAEEQRAPEYWEQHLPNAVKLLNALGVRMHLRRFTCLTNGFSKPSGGSIHGRRVQDQSHKLWELGYNVAAVDYRGFGENRGVPTEQGLYADGATAYQYMRRQFGVPANRVILRRFAQRQDQHSVT
jgi:hypothetical protein